MTRIDVSMVYVHLIWSYMFCIYVIMASLGIYSIWTDLQEVGGEKENWIMFGLVLVWIALAYTLYTITESV